MYNSFRTPAPCKTHVPPDTLHFRQVGRYQETPKRAQETPRIPQETLGYPPGCPLGGVPGGVPWGDLFRAHWGVPQRFPHRSWVESGTILDRIWHDPWSILNRTQFLKDFLQRPRFHLRSAHGFCNLERAEMINFRREYPPNGPKSNAKK